MATEKEIGTITFPPDELKISDATIPTGVVNKSQLDSVAPERSIFMIWAEENANFSTSVGGGFQWSFGNGQETPVNNGVIIPVKCELFAVSLSANTPTSTGTATVGTYRSGIDLETVLDVTVNAGNGYKSVNTLASPVTFTAGQYLNFRTFSVTGIVHLGIITASFRTIV